MEFSASDKTMIVTLFIAEGRERTHGVSTVNNDEESLNKIKSYGFTYSAVQAKTLNEILNESEPNCEIDFISIDVEGHEPNVTKGFSIERWSSTIFIIEDTSNFR